MEKIIEEIQQIFESLEVEPRITDIENVILVEIDGENSVISAAITINTPISLLFQELLEQLLLFDPEEYQLILFEEGEVVEIETLEKDYRHYQKLAKAIQKKLGLTWSEEEEAWSEEKESEEEKENE